MNIGITSQNFRTITGHAGKARRFLIYTVDDAGHWQEMPRLDLPKDMSMHEYRGDMHPVFALDVLITAGCGENFMRRMQARGVKVIATSESDPLRALQAYLAGEALPPPAPHEH